MAENDRIELTYRLWSTGADESFEAYIDHLRSLLPRHRGLMERRVRPVDDALTAPDALVVFSFPDVPSIDGFLRDPPSCGCARACGSSDFAVADH